MKHKVDYEGAYKKALEENIREVRDAVLLGDEGMALKLRNYSEKFSIPIKFLVHKVLQDNLYANAFIKDPAKQSLHQRVAAEYIMSINCVEDFQQLPAGGANARYICNDGVVRVGKNVGNAKSIDFYWVFDGVVYYAAHKHTSDEGGAQDNQFNDLLLFLKNADKSRLAKTVFLAIGDGDYYQRPYVKSGKRYSTRIDYMNSEVHGKKALAITTDDLEEYLISHSSYKELK